MSSKQVTPDMEHRIIKLLVKEDVKPAVTLRRLNAQYGCSSLSRARIYEWCKKLSEDRKRDSNMLHRHIHLTSVTEANILRVDDLILEIKQMEVRNLDMIVQC